MYELFEHTADLGLRIRAPELKTLFEDAAACLFSVILEVPDAVEARTSVLIEISGTDREFLLFDWLRELLLQFDADHMLFSRFEVQLRDEGLTGTAWGEALDPTRHELAREVKAITYHELKVVKDNDGWLAEVIVDI